MSAADDEPFVFYLQIDCPKCGEDIFYGLCMTTLIHRGRPAIPIDIGATDTYDCTNCGTTVYTGDLEIST